MTVRIHRLAPDPYLRPVEELQGISLYVLDPVKTRIIVDGHEVQELQRNDPDHTGRPSLSFPWNPLRFPDL